MRGKEQTPEEEIRYLKSRVNYWEARIVETSKIAAKLEMENYYLKKEISELKTKQLIQLS